MASLIPRFVKEEVVEAWRGLDLWLILLNENHNPDASNQRYYAEISENEIEDSGGAYIKGTGIHITANKTNQRHGNNYYLDLPDIDIGPGANLNYMYAALITHTGGSGPATYRILAQVDFGSNQIVTNGTSTIQWNALGVIYVS